MGMAASQARLMSLTARLSDLEYKAQAIQNDKIRLSDMSEQAATDYSKALDKQVLKVGSNGNSTYAEATVSNMVSYTTSTNLDETNSKYRYMETSGGKLVATEALLKQAGLTVTNGVVTGGAVISEDAFLAKCDIEKDSNGQLLPDSQSYKYYSDLYTKIANGNYEVVSNDNANDPEWLTGQIQLGNVSLYEYNKAGGADGSGAFEDTTWNSGDSTLEMTDDKTQLARAEANYDATMASIESKDKRFDLELTSINTEHTAIQTEIDSVKKVIDKNIERSFKTFDA